jgi:hypothetical protein
MFRSVWFFLGCLAVLASFVGCDFGGGGVATIPVSGTVTLDGSPVAGARVAFSPKSPEGRAAAGITDTSGRFTLTTVEAGDGAMAGSYTVTISKTAASKTPGQADPRGTGGQMNPQDMEAIMKGKAGETKEAAQSLLPEKYASADTSGFTAEVGEKRDFTFDMKSQ